MGRLSRRGLLTASGAGVVAGAAATAGAFLLGEAEPPASAAPAQVVDFHGPHQAGIATPVQDRLHFAAFDVAVGTCEELIALLVSWTRAAESMTAGRVSAADDSGEALDLPASRLTMTVGFGPTLFERAGEDRFGLAASRPPALADLPPFPGEKLDPARGGGDIAVQACADDPQVAVHAIRTLARIGLGRVSMRWSQLGYGKTSSTTPAQLTPRNLMGFKDGTDNIPHDDHTALDQHVWVGAADGPAWMAGGSYLVARRIRMHLEAWDQASREDQEATIGRTKTEGAPLGGKGERDKFSPAALPADSHVRLAHPLSNGGVRLLRRGYSFVDGSDTQGRIDAGLFFLAYQRDPRRQYVPVQRRLATDDRLSTYIRHVGSGLWACPPGVSPGGHWGDTLLGEKA
ncbi:iron uptake transporter deferrochelatase/peroxidase subunit [Nonomuraea sp. NPDC049141]|uniref:iron uptake transporter deferrochelatase/peroxidase subunit n=1 Tax=Nonomuraea sp. NPDC049141 TaxID=3155500 RepID=UPI0033C20D7C